MAEQGYALTAESVRKLQRDHARLANQVYELQQLLRRQARGRVRRIQTLVGKADATIAALSGSTPGSGTVSIWEFNSAGDLVDTGRNETAYNTTPAIVASGPFLQMKRHSQSGRLMIDVEGCS